MTSRIHETSGKQLCGAMFNDVSVSESHLAAALSGLV